MRRILLLVMSVLIASATSVAYSLRWTPSDAEVAKLEASVKLEQLPFWKIQHLPPLSGYARYYAGSTVAGKRVILGEFVLDFDAKHGPGIHLVGGKQDFPMISDGGCTVINISYSLPEKRIVSMQCNGRA